MINLVSRTRNACREDAVAVTTDAALFPLGAHPAVRWRTARWLAKIPDGGAGADGSASRFSRAPLRMRPSPTPTPAAGRRVRDYLKPMPSTPISQLMQEHHCHGPTMNVSAVCASGNAGLLTAKMWLNTHVVDDVAFVAREVRAQCVH
ncbi:MAG: hypothetical protein ABW188_01850 [Rhodococcus fascians]